MTLRDVLRIRGHGPADHLDAPVCDASCRLEERASVTRSEAAIVTTRVR